MMTWVGAVFYWGTTTSNLKYCTEDVPVEIVGATVIEKRDLSSSHD